MKLILIHQHDPTIPHVAGIGTFIDTFIRNAPQDFEIELLGVSANTERYAIGEWHDYEIDDRKFRFFPLAKANPVHIPLFPLSITMAIALYRYRHCFNIKDAILEFHRVEPILAFLDNKAPKVLFLHGHNMKDFYNKNTEVRWGKLPWLYFMLEKLLLPKSRQVYIVREDAVADYQEKYPMMSGQIAFLPTWVDEAVFYCLEKNDKRALRSELLNDHDCADSTQVFLFAGRFEGQKNPIRLLNAFKIFSEQHKHAVLFLIGEGNLKGSMQKYIKTHQLTQAVKFLPPMSQHDVAKWMNASDALCLSSAFEGMPRVVVEALYCGLPVVSTKVGEAWRLIGHDQGGRLVDGDSAEDFASAMFDLLDKPPTVQDCKNQVLPFTAKEILAPIYQQYRELLETT